MVLFNFHILRLAPVTRMG